MGKQEILNILKKEKPYLCEKYGLLRIGLFGSYVKGTESKDSDIDLFVEIKEPRFEFIAGLQVHLEKCFAQPVDIIRLRKGLSERFLRRIEKDIHYA